MMERGPVHDHIWIDEAVHELYRHLTDGGDPLRAPFRNMKEMFLWAACLGFRAGQRRPLDGKRQNILRFAVFSPQTDIPLMKAIAIAETGDVDVLMDTDRMMTIVEEYANAGIHELRAAVVAEQGQPLWNLAALLE